MNENPFASPTPVYRQHLQLLRETLFHLHKALVESERVSYEKNIGTITSPNHFLKLLTEDPWFAWLQPLSRLIVTMDEALDKKKPGETLSAAGAEILVQQTRDLLVASENGQGFARHYFDALQRDPNVVMSHAEAARLFRT